MTDMKSDGEPAFPVQDISKWQCPGMTLRDYFAAKAMQGIVVHDPTFSQKYVDQCAEDAYRYADAMLQERAK